MQQPNSNPPKPNTPVKKATLAFALSLISGILILIRGILWIGLGEKDFFGASEITHRILKGVIAVHVGFIAIVFAVLILIGAMLIYMPGKEKTGGIIVLVFALLSIVTGGGFFIGFILGVVGGILALMKK